MLSLIKPTEPPSSSASAPRLGSLLILAAWFGIIAGLVEGAGLLLFQRINWERWGPTLHVSEQIIWISPAVNLVLFSVLILLLFLAARLAPRVPVIQSALALLIALTVYDWLCITARLSRGSCLLLALGVGVACSRWMTKHEEAVLRFVHRTLPMVAATAVVAFVGIQGSQWLKEKRAVASLPSASADAPNVVVIVVDTLRADHLSTYGYSRPTSPNIDAVAKQGVLFENAISTSSWTFPSHASILTGRYQFEHGMEKIQPMSVFGPDAFSLGGFPTIGEALARRGYRTGAFSANRTFFTRDLGFGRGFIHFEDYFHSAADMLARTLYGRELIGLYVKRLQRSLKRELLGYGQDFGLRKHADAVNQEVVNWINRDAGHPFFVFLNYLDVHEPYGSPSSYPTPEWGQHNATDKYDDGIKYVDDYIGRLLHDLDRRGLSKNTLVVITSDHGESLGQHGLAHHAVALYRELIHVPLIIEYPGHIPTGIRLAQPVTNSAIPATIMGLLGGSDQQVFPGPALSALWQTPGAEPAWPDSLSEVAQRNIFSDENKAASKFVPTTFDGPMKSIVTPRWHLIVHKELGDQLYDWVHDVDESHNVINTPMGQQVARSLSTRLEDLLARADSEKPASTLIALHDGKFNAQETSVRGSGSAGSVDDYYRVEAEAGSVMTVEVDGPPLSSPRLLDPVIAIVDAKGEPYQSCRNPGDDHTQSPGIADSTPDAFDDICVNDDISPGVNTDARLDILVPGADKSNVELIIRVSDWNGLARSQVHYKMQVYDAGDAAGITKAAGQ